MRWPICWATPIVMQFYPAPKTCAEAAEWIAWNQRNYAEHGYGSGSSRHSPVSSSATAA